MTEIIIAVSVAGALILAWIILFILFYFGLINGYHPLKKARGNQIKIACVGDSITYGCMLKDRNKNNYPALLNGLLGENYCVNNYGYTNRTAIKDGDFPLVKEKVYAQSMQFMPDAVIFLLGSNDSKENNWNREKFIADYGEIIDGYIALGSSPKVYALVPPPAFEVRGKVLYKLRKEIIENEICPAVRDIARAKGIDYIDLYSVFEGKPELFADGIHPNAKGSKLLAETVNKVLKAK